MTFDPSSLMFRRVPAENVLMARTGLRWHGAPIEQTWKGVGPPKLAYKPNETRYAGSEVL